MLLSVILLSTSFRNERKREPDCRAVRCTHVEIALFMCFIFPPQGRKSLQKWLPSYLPSASSFDPPETWLPATHRLSRRENMHWDMIPQFHVISLIVIIHLMCQYQAKQTAIRISWSYSEYCEDQTKSFGRNNEEQMYDIKLLLILLQK